MFLNKPMMYSAKEEEEEEEEENPTTATDKQNNPTDTKRVIHVQKSRLNAKEKQPPNSPPHLPLAPPVEFD